MALVRLSVRMSSRASKTSASLRLAVAPRRRSRHGRLRVSRPSRLSAKRGDHSPRTKVASSVAAASNDETLNLSTYSPRRLFQKRHNLFETCLIEIVRRLDKAPLVQFLQVFDSLSFKHQFLSDNEELALNMDGVDVYILCQPIPQGVDREGRHPAALIAGKVGDCCHGEEEEEESHSSNGMVERSAESGFWGLVVRSSVFPEMQGCYLMRTVKSGHETGCHCVHYSVTRICTGIPLTDQFDASWLV